MFTRPHLRRRQRISYSKEILQISFKNHYYHWTVGRGFTVILWLSWVLRVCVCVGGGVHTFPHYRVITGVGCSCPHYKVIMRGLEFFRRSSPHSTDWERLYDQGRAPLPPFHYFIANLGFTIPTMILKMIFPSVCQFTNWTFIRRFNFLMFGLNMLF